MYAVSVPGEILMIPVSLYDAAFAYKKAQLWKQLYDSELFAVRFTDGTTGYCCVLGNLGEDFSLCVYVGAGGLNSFYTMLAMDPDSAAASDDIFLSQNCLKCSFVPENELLEKEYGWLQSYAKKRKIILRGRNAYVSFTRFSSGQFPWYITDKQEQQYMEQAILAACEVSRKLAAASKKELGITEVDEHDAVPLLICNGTGFEWGKTTLPAPQPIKYPQPELTEPSVITKLTSFPKKGTCECALKILPVHIPSEKKGDDTPRMIAILIAADSETGCIISGTPVPYDEDRYDEYIQQLAGVFEKQGSLPQTIKVLDDRTTALLRNFCKQLNIQMSVDSIPAVEEAMDGLTEYLQNTL
jgi:hypothetical protein